MSHSPADVTRHIRQPGVVGWTTLARVLVDGTLSCVDGREPGQVLGTPGGDAGELLVALATVEQLADAPIEDDELVRILDRYLAHFGRFYMHTDSHAIDHLGAALAQDPAFAGLDLSAPGATDALVRAPGDHAAALLPHLIAPDNVGCGHLKLILKHPDDYGVRQGLAQQFIAAVFRALWAGADIHYVVLQGDHAEGAVVQITAGKGMLAHSRVPTVAPCHGESQIFVAHPEVVGWLRSQIAHFLVAEQPVVKDVDPDDLTDAIQDLAGVQLGETLGHLAKGKPVYEARVTESGVVQVTS